MRQDLMNRKHLTAAVAAFTLAVPFAGTALAGGENGKGGERPETAPGQQKHDPAPSAKGQQQAAEARETAAARKPARKNAPSEARAKKPAKAAKPAPASKAQPAPKAKKANPHAKAGKTTICHSTGSETNPYVTITISDNALKAHARHHDGRDIIPAPTTGCPKGAEPAPAAPKPEAGGPDHAKVTICHATGSETNPFVKITIAEAAVAAHKAHQDGRDIIPAPEGDCTATKAAATPPVPAAPSAPSRTVTLLPAPAAALVATGPASVGGEASLPAGARNGVLGEFVSGGDPAAAADPASAVRNELGAGAPGLSLPFTGLELWLVVVAGLGALLAGVALRRAGRVNA